MRLWKSLVALLMVSTVALVSTAMAQERKTETTTKTEITTTTKAVNWNQPATRWQKGSDIIGKNVDTPAGEKIGDVDDMVVDLKSGRVVYMILDCGLGRQCAVPPMAMQLPADAKKYLLAHNRDQLKAYSFERGRFPDFNDRNWATQNFAHYKIEPFWTDTDVTVTTTRKPGDVTLAAYNQFPTQWMKASEIIGKDVRNPQNENLGKIEDISVDPDGGRVIYAVLSFGGFLGLGDKFFALPWSSLANNLSGDQKHFVLNVDKDRLKNAQGFDKKNWPNMAENRWATETATFYGQPPYWQPDSVNPNLPNENRNNPNNPNTNPNRDGSRNP